MRSRRVVIVGASVAGITAADTLREEGFGGEIVVLGDEAHLPYDRPPLSKEALTGDAAELATGRLLRPAEHFAAMRIDLRTGVRATGIDTVAQTVATTAGPVAYDALIVATGCHARRMATASGEPLPVVRTLDDARALKTAAGRTSSAILIGAGFIGLEVAAALRTLGLDVTVVGATALPLATVVGEDIGRWLQRLHRQQGVQMIGGRSVSTVTGGPGAYLVRLDDGTELAAGLVLAGIGVIPNTAWLAASPIALGDGVVCDAAGRTSIAGVWAGGDVAAYPSATGLRRVEHWTNAVEQGRHVALNIVRGTAEPFLCVPYAWSDQFDVKLQTLGRMQPDDETIVVEGALDGAEFLALHGSGGCFHGVTATGASPRLRAYRKMLRAGASWAEAKAFASTRPDIAGAA